MLGEGALINAALGKVVGQLSNVVTAPMSVDGKLDTCSSTLISRPKPWWYVTLGDTYTIVEVRITNHQESRKYSSSIIRHDTRRGYGRELQGHSTLRVNTD